MTRRVRYGAMMPVFELENLYRKEYRGSEADIRFQPTMENCLRFDCIVEIPHMLSTKPEIEERFKKVMDRCLREMMYECGKLGSEMLVANKD
jgi:hypothetical protein